MHLFVGSEYPLVKGRVKERQTEEIRTMDLAILSATVYHLGYLHGPKSGINLFFFRMLSLIADIWGLFLCISLLKRSAIFEKNCEIKRKMKQSKSFFA